MGRPPKHPVETKLKIVLSVISGESTQAEAARRHGVSQLEAEIDDLTRALGEAHVQIRVLKRGGPSGMTFR